MYTSRGGRGLVESCKGPGFRVLECIRAVRVTTLWGQILASRVRAYDVFDYLQSWRDFMRIEVPDSGCGVVRLL